MHTRVWRNHVHAKPQCGFEELFVPVERNVPNAQRIASVFKRARQDVLIIVEHPAILDSRRWGKLVRLCQNERLTNLRGLSAPEVERVDTQALDLLTNYGEEAKVLALTRMHDDYHDMSLAILLDSDYRIEEIAGRMDRIPYPCCETRPLEMLSALKGIEVLARGGLKTVKERIPRNQGCTHVYEMIESTFRAIFVGSYSIHGQKWQGVLELDPEENRQLGLQSPVLADTCYAFHRDSVDPEVLARARKKVEEARKKMAAIDAVKRGG